MRYGSQAIPKSSDVSDTIQNSPMPRRLLFLSHATPEDNAFVTWLATQLANSGYEVWCDVTELLGGERFWNDIEDAIENHAFRFLFVSTLEANRKPGTLRELDLALAAQAKHGLGDFVVPLKVDQFPFASMQKRIRDLNVMRFDESWATGLTQLLKLLEREGTPRSPTAGPDCVADWYTRSMSRIRQLVISDERCLANWFRLRLPKLIRLHHVESPIESCSIALGSFARPHRVLGNHVVTFAPLSEVQAHVGLDVRFGATIEVSTSRFIRGGEDTLPIAQPDAFNLVSDLVGQAWDRHMTVLGLRNHELASGLNAWFFKEGHLQNNKAYFTPNGGRRSYRQLVGQKSKKTLDGSRVRDGFWHYAASASTQLLPFPRFVLRHHVIFTDDGEMPWQSAERMHKARRSVCKNWWNREWRDRLLAFSAEMGGQGGTLHLPVGTDLSIAVTMKPMDFISPWTYFEDGETGIDESQPVELVEEEEELDDEDDA